LALTASRGIVPIILRGGGSFRQRARRHV